MSQNAVKVKAIYAERLNILRRPLGASWKSAAGLLKHKQKALIQHSRRVRNEWGLKATHRLHDARH